MVKIPACCQINKKANHQLKNEIPEENRRQVKTGPDSQHKIQGNPRHTANGRDSEAGELRLLGHLIQM